MQRNILKRRKLDPSKFFFTNKFKQWTNTHKKTFDNITRDESRIVIPLYDDKNNLTGFQGRSLVPNSVKYITVMINEEAPKIYGLDRIKTEKPIYVLKVPSIPPSWKTRLLCAVPILILGRLVGAIIFGFLIMNLATEKSSTESPKLLIEEIK